MAIQIIPLKPELLKYSILTDLDGVLFEMAFDFKSRQQSWYMELKDISGNILISGVKMVLGTLMLTKHKTEFFPQGKLFLFDKTGTNLSVDADTFGKDVQLLYETVG